jgi:hypothetical protein
MAVESMQFPAMTVKQAFAAFTRAAYGKELELEHA